MTWSARTARRVPRAAARTTALVSVLAASGVVAGTASAAGGHPGPAQAIATTLAYGCRFPSGPHRITVTVTAGIPGAGRTGRPIRPTGARLSIAFPRAAAPDLARLRSATVSAATSLTIDATEGPVGTSVAWPGATRTIAAIPKAGGLTLRTSGPVPPVTATTPGEVVLAAAGLSMTLIPGDAPVPVPGTSPKPVSGGPNQGPPPTAPPGSRTALRVTCIPAKGQQVILATVPVTGKPPARAGRRSAAVTFCPSFPKKGLKLNPRFHHPKPPPGSVKSTFPQQGCAYTTGYADARKLKGAALIQPGLTNVELFLLIFQNQKQNYFQADNAAALDFHGQRIFPPSTATFLTFGFVPTTATIELVEHGTIDIFAVGPLLAANCKKLHQNCITTATVASRLSVKIVPGSVKVNGVPLDVGTQCETGQFDAILTGNDHSKPPYSVQFGGPLTGVVNIPDFSHCGVGEDLDPIFNAAISGPQNFNLLTQGQVCFVQGGGSGCNPQTGLPAKPKPLRKVVG